MLSAAGVVHHGGQALVQQRRVLVKERVEQRLVSCHEAAQPVFKRASQQSEWQIKKNMKRKVSDDIVRSCPRNWFSAIV